jgi:hypothetical protein
MLANEWGPLLALALIVFIFRFVIPFGNVVSVVIVMLLYRWLKKSGNCQKKFCQILLNFYSLKRPFRV